METKGRGNILPELILASNAAVFCVYKNAEQLEVFRCDQLSRSKIDRSFFKKAEVEDLDKLNGQSNMSVGVVSADCENLSSRLSVEPFLSISELQALQVDLIVGDDGKSFFEKSNNSANIVVVDTNGENWTFIEKGKDYSIVSLARMMEDKLKTELNLRELGGNLSDIIQSKTISIFGKNTSIAHIIEKFFSSLKDDNLHAFADAKSPLYILGNDRVVADEILRALGFTIIDADVVKISILSGLAKAMFIKMSIKAEGND